MALSRTDGSRRNTLPDGTVVSTELEGDPRFGRQAPVVARGTVTTPSGLTLVTRSTREVALSDPTDLLSIETLTGTSSVDGRTIDFGFDCHGNLTSVTPPGRLAHHFGRTARDLPESYSPPEVGGESAETSYLQDRDRAETEIRHSDGRTVASGYDGAGRLATVDFSAGRLSWSYQATTGRVAGVGAPGGGSSLGYSWDGPLLLGTTRSGAVAGMVGRTFDAGFRLASLSVNGSAVGFTYDDDDNLTGAGGLTLTWDPAHGMLTATGALAQELDHDAVGRVTKDTNPGFQPFGFAGGLYDPDTGLVRFGARDYDPVAGRFTARDPILFTGDQANLYAYAGGDPVNLVDPGGLGPLSPPEEAPNFLTIPMDPGRTYPAQLTKVKGGVADVQVKLKGSDNWVPRWSARLRPGDRIRTRGDAVIEVIVDVPRAGSRMTIVPPGYEILLTDEVIPRPKEIPLPKFQRAGTTERGYYEVGPYHNGLATRG